MKERKRRSIIKTLTWRLTASLTTVLLVFLFTGELFLSLGIAGTEVILKMFIYYGHERAWSKIKWGRLE